MSDFERTDTSPAGIVRYTDPKTGKFAAGNPGKPKGARTRFSQATLQEIVSLKDNAIDVLRQRLNSGDMEAARFVLERIIGKNTRFLELSGTDPDSVSADLMSGSITVDEAKDIALTVSRLVQVEKIAQLEARLEELDKLLKSASFEP